jgi:hypothetical protein
LARSDYFIYDQNVPNRIRQVKRLSQVATEKTGTTSLAPVTEVTAAMLEDVSATRGWTLFFAILGWIAFGLTAILGVVALAFGATVDGAGPVRLAGWIYIIAALMYLPPALWLQRYALAVKRLRSSRSLRDLEQALHNEHRFFRFAALLMLISLGLAVLGVIAAITIPFLLGGGA